jgi:hypothetical protein
MIRLNATAIHDPILPGALALPPIGNFDSLYYYPSIKRGLSGGFSGVFE